MSRTLKLTDSQIVTTIDIITYHESNLTWERCQQIAHNVDLLALQFIFPGVTEAPYWIKTVKQLYFFLDGNMNGAAGNVSQAAVLAWNNLEFVVQEGIHQRLHRFLCDYSDFIFYSTAIREHSEDDPDELTGIAISYCNQVINRIIATRIDNHK